MSSICVLRESMKDSPFFNKPDAYAALQAQNPVGPGRY